MMRFFPLLLIYFYTQLLFAQVGIGTPLPDESAVLELKSTEKGFLPPRLTEEDRNQIENPAAGLIIYNLDQKCLNFFNSNYWFSPCSPNAEGGDIVQEVEIHGVMYRIHQFTSTGSSTFTVTRSGDFDYLIVAGGGGGASRHGGGGGAGGVISSFLANENPLFLEEGEYEIVVGKGGNGSPSGSSTTGVKGEDSSAFNFVAFGGGAGGGTNTKSTLQDGGSGGGSRGNSNALGGIGATNQGTNGAAGQNQNKPVNYGLGGGGGGFSEEGYGPNSNNGFRGRGGDGFDASSFIGEDFGDVGWFAGGGGSGSRNVPATAGNIGGKGGGGNGNTNSINNATAGEDGTGGGGAGGGHSSSAEFEGKKGGSGTVIIRYKL